MKILVLSPHTDDAELGAGGSIVRFITEKHKVLWIVFSTAEQSLPKNMKKGALKNEFLSVVNYLNEQVGKIKYKIFNYEVRKLNFVRQNILEDLVKIRNDFKPDLVIGPSLNDFHQDHVTVANEMVRAFKTSSKIISYELPWNHINFETKLFVKLTKSHTEYKWRLLQNYKSQFIKNRIYFSKEYVFGLAKVRGTQCNAEYAEAFEVVRWTL